MQKVALILALFYGYIVAHAVTIQKMQGRLFEPRGTVSVMHNNKTYRVYDRFKVYKNDVIYLDDNSSSVKLVIYKNGSILYNLQGKRVFAVKQFLFRNNKPITMKKTNIRIKMNNAIKSYDEKPYNVNKTQRNKIFVQDDFE